MKYMYGICQACRPKNVHICGLGVCTVNCAPTTNECCDKCKDIDIDEPNNPLGCAYPTCPCHKREEVKLPERISIMPIDHTEREELPHKGYNECPTAFKGEPEGKFVRIFECKCKREEKCEVSGRTYRVPNHTKIEKLAKVPTGYSDTATLTPHAWNLLADKLNEIIDYLNQL